MAYNNFGNSTTLTAIEMSAEARRLLDLLDGVDQEDLERRLSPRALQFVEEMQMARSLAGGGEVAVTENQLYWLRNLWQKFA